MVVMPPDRTAITQENPQAFLIVRNKITDELAAMVDEEIKRGEDGDTEDDGEDGGTFWMMSAGKRVKLVGTAQSLIASITDALRTATTDHSKVFEVIALLSAITDTISGKRH
jgi:hypothetical protein